MCDVVLEMIEKSHHMWQFLKLFRKYIFEVVQEYFHFLSAKLIVFSFIPNFT